MCRLTLPAKPWRRNGNSQLARSDQSDGATSYETTTALLGRPGRSPAKSASCQQLATRYLLWLADFRRDEAARAEHAAELVKVDARGIDNGLLGEWVVYRLNQSIQLGHVLNVNCRV